ncbi:hypothetical protein E0W68_03025 [Flavobacterium salilacus subsp. salilacus]|uniref:hypothetical protein n=1 Tax=Flavobacterium TaxID=237 RepID=UPI0010755CF8|nr:MULTISPECIES: hypothetical protein [Flavobacterium]KAF2519341.1 hypothetical protein E0W68_03025 [Flavobacterium salilacus subsp. salilacus]MBE1614773.1 hypothetical protein [Flavobacterium sp. SaA2.13]
MKSKMFIILILISNLTFAQNPDLTFQSLKEHLVDFLIEKGDIRENEIKEFKNDLEKIKVIGVYNNVNKGKLINGVYSFFIPRTIARSNFVIVDDNKFIILDLTNKEGLESSISNLMIFCEKQNYCYTITQDYISRMIRIFYTINKNPKLRKDFNCEQEYGVISTESLP